MPYPRIHNPILYSWELNETHNRYDYGRAQPEPETLHLEFAILAAINALVSAVVLLLIVALWRSPRVRGNTFNLYIFFIAIPDFLVSFLCLCTCALSAPASTYFSEWMCGWQSFYLNFSFISNAWLNGAICWQIHRMLQFSNMRKRYQPPTKRQVLWHAGLVYGYAILWGFLCGFNVSFLPLSSHLYYGFVCMPMQYNLPSTLFFWIIYLQFSLGLPLNYVSYVFYDIYRNNLMPPTGRRRKVAMFLLKLCSTYFALWMPYLLLSLIGTIVKLHPFVLWAGAAMAHLQGIVSAGFCFSAHDDIRQSAWLLVTCQPAEREVRFLAARRQSCRGPGGVMLPSLDDSNTDRGTLRRYSIAWQSWRRLLPSSEGDAASPVPPSSSTTHHQLSCMDISEHSFDDEEERDSHDLHGSDADPGKHAKQPWEASERIEDQTQAVGDPITLEPAEGAEGE